MALFMIDVINPFLDASNWSKPAASTVDILKFTVAPIPCPLVWSITVSLGCNIAGNPPLPSTPPALAPKPV